MANYTMRADGTAANLAAALDGDPSVVSECLSVATHNSVASGASAGDHFQLADTGGDYRSTLVVQRSGTSGNEMVYEAYSGHSPVLNGSDLITGWTSYSGDIWQATVAYNPRWLWVDGTTGIRRPDLTIGTTLDTLSTPSSSTTFDSDGDGHINFVWTVEHNTSVIIGIRYIDAQNRVVVQCRADGSDPLVLSYNDQDGEHIVRTITGIFDTETSKEVDIYFSGTSIQVDVDSVNKIDETLDWNTEQAGSIIYHDLASNDIALTSYAEVGHMTQTGEFYWDGASTLYLVDTSGDPDSRSNPGIEVHSNSRNYCLNTDQQNYLTIDGLTFAKASQWGLYHQASSYTITQNCIGEWCWQSGLAYWQQTTIETDITVQDNILRYCGTSGMDLTAFQTGGMVNCITRRNTVYSNGRYQWASPLWDAGAHTYTGGIKVGSDGERFVTSEIYENECYENGPVGQIINSAQKGNGIWVDGQGGTSTDHLLVHRNYCHDNVGCGVFVEVTSYNTVFANVLAANATGSNMRYVYSAAGIRVDSRESYLSNHNKFFNNTIYNSIVGLVALTYSQSGGIDLSHNEFKNNIVASCDCSLYADDGGDNDGVYGDNNVFSKNCLDAEATSFIYWGGSWYDTYDSWLAVATDQLDNNIEADPLLWNPASNQFWLSPGSPCIDAGLNL